MTETKTPAVALSRRMAARLLRASRGGVIGLKAQDEDRCVDGVTRGFIPAAHRRYLLKLWREHGSTVTQSELDQKSRRSPLDPQLHELLEERNTP